MRAFYFENGALKPLYVKFNFKTVGMVMPAIDSTIEREFAHLVARWKDETGVFSTTCDKVVNDSFL